MNSIFKNKFVQKIISKPARFVLIGYASYVLITWLLLCLPICWQADPITPLDNLFIATSAISTTGLITVNTPDAYNFLGEFIVACAFQVGGLGYMTLGSFVVLFRDSELSSMRQRVGETVFSLPEGFNFKSFIQHTIIFTALIELAGFIGLYIAFSREGVPNAIWAAIFHSISAFCTAGFSVFPDSLMGFRDNLLVNVVVTVLSLFGAIGFIVVSDVWLGLTRRRRSLSLTTKIIIYITFAFIVGGWAFLFFTDPSIVELPLSERLLASGFQAMTAMTTVGFNTHPIEVLAPSPVLVMVILMVIGASPSGTGGGLKTTSISAALGAVWASLRGYENVVFGRRRIPTERVFAAFAALAFYLIMFLVGSVVLLLLQSQAFEDVVFEAASALGTVGLSRGITGDLVPFGKLLIIFLMFVGRIGPITFGLALFNQTKQSIRHAKEDIAI
ncbi:potassium transporter TrkG [Oscillatoria sp. CS-180]|uniref:TrkH family potassium uptake protein n=1 Tax=Oscillatoria sp. CS-180 TaxID=3021720 RepID=UPI0023314A7C|nr:potassium transporter TrkG [Oscillatoria sp. CS-180]MDB9524996.1 potassium transporter TrkG [Oscillatoria sp. CS-180]